MPPWSGSMVGNLSQWFVYLLVVNLLAAYVAAAAVPPGASFTQLCRFAGTAAFMGYTLALWQMSIWYRRAWSMTLKSTVDGVIYAAVTCAVFGWLWPK
jgi:hypothetical protein